MTGKRFQQVVVGMNMNCTVGNERHNRMKKIRFFGLFLLFVLAATLLAIFYLNGSRSKHCVLIEEMGDKFTVSVYQLPKPLRIPACYRPGDLKKETKSYPWLMPFLFTRFGIDVYIPREDWDEYAAFEWDEKVYAEMVKKCEDLKTIVFDKDSAYWSGVHIEIREVVLCETEKHRGLEVFAKGFDPDGKSLGGEYHKLVDFQGKWKRTPDKDQGRYATQLMNCYEKAMKLVAEGKLKTNPIRKLR